MGEMGREGEARVGVLGSGGVGRCPRPGVRHGGMGTYRCGGEARGREAGATKGIRTNGQEGMGRRNVNRGDAGEEGASRSAERTASLSVLYGPQVVQHEGTGGGEAGPVGSTGTAGGVEESLVGHFRSLYMQQELEIPDDLAASDLR